MQFIDGNIIMRGLAWDNPLRIRTAAELVRWIQEIGFLPLFSNGVEGFSVEEHTAASCWWSEDEEQDPWEWREILAGGHEVVYGKFFDNKAGFLSREWLPVFANARRNGYDFDARYEEGLAGNREKAIMDFYLLRSEDGEIHFKRDEILSTDLKKAAGFTKGGFKNFPGILTSLQMQTYLVTAGFRRRTGQKGQAYGMSVAIMLPPESVWGYEAVARGYEEEPGQSWTRIFEHIKALYPSAKDSEIRKLTGKYPES